MTRRDTMDAEWREHMRAATVAQLCSTDAIHEHVQTFHHRIVVDGLRDTSLGNQDDVQGVISRFVAEGVGGAVDPCAMRRLAESQRSHVRARCIAELTQMVAARSLDGFTSLAADGQPTDLSSLRAFRPCLVDEPAERVEGTRCAPGSRRRYTYLPRVLAAFEELGYEVGYTWANPRLFTLEWQGEAAAASVSTECCRLTEDYGSV